MVWRTNGLFWLRHGGSADSIHFEPPTGYFSFRTYFRSAPTRHGTGWVGTGRSARTAAGKWIPMANLRCLRPDCSAPDSVLFYSPSKSFQAEGEPNAPWQTALNCALCPVTTKGTGIGKLSRTATRSLRAALLIRSPLRANRQTKRREKQS